MAALAVLGASGHGRVVAEAAEATGLWSEIVFFDDAWPGLAENGPWPVLGDMEVLLRSLGSYGGIVVAIGRNQIRLAKCRMFTQRGATLVNVIHPAAVVSPRACLAGGCVVLAGAVVNIDARLGLGCIVNTGAGIDHDCVLGDGVHVSPGAHLAGGVRVGEASWIGIGASVRELIEIGRDSVVGGGAAVVAAVPDRCTVAGVPARVVRQHVSGNGSC